MKNIHLIILSSLFIVSSCGGGGGGGGSSAPPAPSNPAPTINFSASSSSAATGTTVTLTFSSSNASSCSASGSSDWTGDKGTSGSGDVKIAYGTNTFSLSCSGAGGSSSKNVTVEGTQIFDESAFVPLGETKTYEGFVFNKEEGYTGCLASIEMDLTNNDNFLSVTRYSVNEWRYIGYYDEGGLKLSNNFVTSEGDEPGTFYTISITDSSLNGIDVSEVDINPYTFEADTLEDFEQFSADISLDVDYGEDGDGYYCNPDMEIGLWAFPNSSETETDSFFIGTSDNADGYTFLYMVSQDYADTFADNLPTESDIFSINWADLDVYTSYMSNPNIVLSDYGFRVKTTLVESANNTGDGNIQTIIGSRLVDSTLVSDNSIWYVDDYIMKYLYKDGESWSSQRIFLNVDISSDCFRSYSYYRTCYFQDPEILFFTPDKEELLGFKLGGYNSTSETSSVKVVLNSDAE
tara:strand:+ start:154 stop:1542 length:1389 start_codon:yes stop_codon:yes gene_type:complete